MDRERSFHSSFQRSSFNNTSFNPVASSSVIIQEETGGNGDYDGESTSEGARISPPPSSTSSNSSIFSGTILERSLLRDKLEERAIQIAQLKMQLLEALKSHQRLEKQLMEYDGDEDYNNYSAGGHRRHNNTAFELEPSFLIEEPDETATDLEMSIRQGLVRWAHTIDHEQVVQHVQHGTQAVSHLLVGDIAGWSAAYLIQKFGKVAVTALGGGLILLQLAHHKGYIMVNWSNIYNQLEQAATEENEAAVEDWVANKMKALKVWTKDHSCVVVGFVCGFLYKSFR